MRQIFLFAFLLLVLFLFWSCGDDSNPVNPTASNFDPFALWDTAANISLGIRVECLAVKDTFLFAGTPNNGVYRSSNRGDTWGPANTGLAGSSAVIHAMLVIDTIILAGTNDGVYVSANNGSNWTASNSGMGSVIVTSIVRKDTFLFAGTNSGVFISADKGTSWSSSGLGTFVINTLCVKGKRLFAGTTSTANGLYRSTNNGGNWLRIVDGMPSLAVSSLAAKDTNLFAATADGVYRSSNDSTWTRVSEGLYNALTVSEPVSFLVYGSGVLVGMTNYQGVYLSLTNGSTWISANAGLYGFTTYCFTYDGSYIYIGGQNEGGGGGVWRHAL